MSRRPLTVAIVSIAVLFLASSTAFSNAAPPSHPAKQSEQKYAVNLYKRITGYIRDDHHDDRARSPEFQRAIDRYTPHVKTRADAILAARSVISKLNDSYSCLLDNRGLEQRTERQAATTTTLGIEAGLNKKKNLQVQSVQEGGSGADLGLVQGDEIVEINGKPIAELHPPEVLESLHRRPVTVTYQRGKQRLTKTLSKPKDRRCVQAGWITPDIAYMSITDFDNRIVVQQMQQAIDALGIAGAHKLILDLRGNFGGFLNNAAQTAGFLIGEAPNVAQLKTARSNAPINLRWPTSNPQFKGDLIVLVDGRTGSASEMLAAIIQSRKRGVIIGDKTAGCNVWKGDKQIEPGLVLYLAFAEWKVQPGKYSGIIPDKAVPLNPDEQRAGKGHWLTYRSSFAPERDSERDKQLHAAIDLLRK